MLANIAEVCCSSIPNACKLTVIEVAVQLVVSVSEHVCVPQPSTDVLAEQRDNLRFFSDTGDASRPKTLLSVYFVTY